VDRELARLAGASHGVVTRAQLLRGGITPEAIRQRLERGALLREHRCVYRVGHRAPSIQATYLAAVLACGDGALISGHAAGYLLGILKGSAPSAEVTTRGRRLVTGVRTRRSRHLDAAEATVWRGIPVTSVPRTLVDLAAELGMGELARACHEAGIRHGTTPAAVEASLARRPQCAGGRTSPPGPHGRGEGQSEQARSRLPGPAARRRPPASRYQPSRRGTKSRLPLARPAAHRRTRRLPLSPLAALVGAGPTPGKGSVRARRRASALHVRRRLREPRSDDGGVAADLARHRRPGDVLAEAQLTGRVRSRLDQ
jgi:hypothetical protein